MGSNLVLVDQLAAVVVALRGTENEGGELDLQPGFAQGFYQRVWLTTRTGIFYWG